jgi:hypothetical protein
MILKLTYPEFHNVNNIFIISVKIYMKWVALCKTIGQNFFATASSKTNNYCFVNAKLINPASAERGSMKTALLCLTSVFSTSYVAF